MGAARPSTGAAAAYIWGSPRATLLPPTVAVFVAAGHCWRRTRDNAACVSAAVHDGSPRRCACATGAAMSLTELAECSSDVPLDIAPWRLLASKLCSAYKAGQSLAPRLCVLRMPLTRSPAEGACGMVLRLPLLWTAAYTDMRVLLRAQLVCCEHPRPWPGGATPCGDIPP